MYEQDRKLRKIAGKGLVILLCVLFLCIFFSGTLKTLTTPRVQDVSPTTGKFRDTISLAGTFHIGEGIKIAPEKLPDNVSIAVKDIYVFPGQWVPAGMILFSVEAVDYDNKMAELQTTYLQNGHELLMLEQNPVKLLRSDEQWFSAWEHLQMTEKALLDQQIKGVVDEETRRNAEKAREDFLYADRIGIDAEAYAWYTKKQQLEEERETLLTSMKELKNIQDHGIVTAPHDGYIMEVSAQAGHSWDGNSALVTMSAEGINPCIRVYTDESSRSLNAGMTVIIPTPEKGLRTKVISVGYDAYGKPFADIDLPEDMVTALGGAPSLMSRPVTVQLQYTSETTFTQIPVNSLRSNGVEEFVYVIEESENIFGVSVLKLKKQTVKVADLSDTMAAVTGLSRDVQIACMEDKPLQDGMEVMLYGTIP